MNKKNIAIFILSMVLQLSVDGQPVDNGRVKCFISITSPTMPPEVPYDVDCNAIDHVENGTLIIKALTPESGSTPLQKAVYNLQKTSGTRQ